MLVLSFPGGCEGAVRAPEQLPRRPGTPVEPR
jgi:hypothetical protein